MDPQLKDAAQRGDINALYALIRANPNILKTIDEIPFVDTPLHLAAAAGHIHFALEMMRLMPSFARKLNEDGFSPLHLALQNDNYNTQIVLRLIHVDPGLIRVKGREGITPLHYVAGKEDDPTMLLIFLSLCPESIEDLTIRSETALHIAVKEKKSKAFEVLLGWLQLGIHKEIDDLKNKVLNWKDDQGNTLLHISTSTNQHQVMRLLILNNVNVNDMNLEKLTALDILESQGQRVNRAMIDLLCRAKAKRASSLCANYIVLANCLTPKARLYQILTSPIRIGNSFMSGENRSAMLVVAVLIATATYHTGLNPPGGFQQVQRNVNSSSYGITNTSNINDINVKPFMRGVYYLIFQVTNTTAFCASMGFMFLLVPTGAGVLLLVFSLIACYIFSVTFISPSYFAAVIYSVLLFIALSIIFILIMYTRHFGWLAQVTQFSELWQRQPRRGEMITKTFLFFYALIFCAGMSMVASVFKDSIPWE